MDGGSSSPMVWKNGRLQDAPRTGGSLAALCAAVEQAVKAHRTEGTAVRAVILMLEDAPGAKAVPESPAVYVDVYDSGYGHGI